MQMPRWVLEAEARITDKDRELENLPFKEGDEDLGEVPEELRQMYYIRNLLLREANEFYHAHRKVCQDLECSCEEFVNGMVVLKNQYDCMDTFFWVSLDTMFKAFEISIDIRNGWRVVSCPDDDDENSDDLDIALTDAISRGRMVANLAILDMDQSRPN
jgi:hypothetical protein